MPNSASAPQATPPTPPTKPLIPLDQIPTLQVSLSKLDTTQFPSELTPYHYFLLWRPVPNNPTAPTKILKKPIAPDWQNNTTSIQETLTNRSASKWPTPPGVGFAYSNHHPVLCIDIDADTPDNNLLIKSLDSYTEISPSGKGYHVMVMCESLQVKEQLSRTFGTGKRDHNNKRDLFVSSGYTTLTGLFSTQYPNKPIRTIPTTELIQTLSKYFLPQQSQIDQSEAEALERFANMPKQDHTIAPARAKQPLKPKSSGDNLSVAQVKALLNQINVSNLTSDIFTRLYRNELAVLDPDETEEAREPWLIVGQAIHHNFGGQLEGYYLWDSWSQRGSKYDSTSCTATWESFKTSKPGAPVTIAALIKLVKAQQPQFPDKTAKGVLKGTLANFYTYIEFYKFQLFHNEITKECQVTVPKEILTKWKVHKLAPGQTLSMSEICEFMLSDLLVLGFPQAAYSNQKLKRITTAMSKVNSYNPIREYFETCGAAWDGKDRINDLVNTLTFTTLADREYRDAYTMFIRKWLIQVAAAACHRASHPVRLNRVIIFSGPQDIGKTRWVESLFPQELRKYCMADKEIRLSSFRSDSVKLTMELGNTLICNINEIDRLFKQANFSDFKSFLDQTVDRIVLPYGDAPTEMSRRTVFIGSTNLDSFLKDQTGNRRFEIISCIKMDFRHQIDINQLWGQVFAMYSGGERWWLDITKADEAAVLKQRDIINTGSMYIGNEAIVETLDEMFDVDLAKATNSWKKYTFKDIRMILGITNVATNSMAFNQAKRAVTQWSKIVSGKDPIAGTGERARIFYYMPPLRTETKQYNDEPSDTMDDDTTDEQIEAIKEQMKQLKLRLTTLKQKD